MATFSTELIGLVAGCLTTGAFLPQVLKTWRSRSVRDLSLRMYLALAAGVFLWLVYGLLVGSPSIIVANAVTLVLALAILVMQLRFK